jgi:spore germination protein YaaH
VVNKRARQIASIALSAFLIFPSTAPAKADNTSGNVRKILTGWVPYYGTRSLPSSQVNQDLIAEITPFWYQLTDQRTITNQYGANSAKVTQDWKAAGIKVLPTITDGTGTDVLTGLLGNPAARADMITAIMKVISDGNYDGIDLDWENFTKPTWDITKPRWITFIHELSQALHATGKLLSVTTLYQLDPATGLRGYYFYAWQDIAPDIDRLRVMTYDKNIANPGPNGPINWTTDVIKYAISVMPASKVFVGTPGYGRDWAVTVTGTCPVDVAKTITKPAIVVMHDALTLASTYGVTPTYDAKNGESTFTYQKTYNGLTASGAATQCTATRTVWYPDEKSYQWHANLVSQYHLGGMAVWTFGMENEVAMSQVRSVAQNIAPDVITSVLTVDQNAVTIGMPITVTGRIAKQDTTPVSGIPMTLQIKSAQGDWRDVQLGNSSNDGTVSSSILLGGTTQLRLTSPASWERLAGISAVKNIAVTPLISWTAPTSIRAGQSFPITGAIQPATGGVTIQSNTGESATTSPDGHFTLTVKTQKSGILTIQLSSLQTTSLAASKTDAFSLLVR